MVNNCILTVCNST